MATWRRSPTLLTSGAQAPFVCRHWRNVHAKVFRLWAVKERLHVVGLKAFYQLVHLTGKGKRQAAGLRQIHGPFSCHVNRVESQRLRVPL